MKVGCFLVLFIISFLFSNDDAAQSAPLAFSVVTGSKDVTLGKINGITQDTWGYMWFADPGNSQLVRYDGYRMKVFKHNRTDTNSINKSFFECIAADSVGNVWLPFDGGVDKIASATGMATHYKLKIAVGDAIIVDHEGVVWIGGSGGLCQLDPETGKAINYSHSDKDSTTLSDGGVRVLYEDREGTIWAGSGLPFVPGNDGGLNKFNRATGKFTRYVNDPADPRSIINNRVRAILEDSRGSFWIGTQGNGLHIMDRKTGTFERLTYDPKRPEKLSRPPVKKGDSFDHITFIKEDISGNIWIGTYHEGIERYDPLTKKLDHFIADATGAGGFPDSTTWTAFTSRDGTLWIATETSNLLYRVDPFRKSIAHISTGHTASSFAEDKNGDLWVGTEGNGIFKFDQNNIEVAHFIHNPLDPFSPPENHCMLSAVPGADKIWSGSYDGIRMIDAQTDKFYKVNSSSRLLEDSSQKGIVSALEDKTGIYWFASWGHGLIRLNAKDASTKQFLPDPKDSTSISSAQLNHLLEDKQGRLWIVGGGGINRMDRKIEKFKKYLPETFIGSIYQDSKNNIWAGTDKGLYHYNEQDDQFYPFFEDFINISTLGLGGIVEDNDHDLWLRSASSIIKLDPLTKDFFIYGEKFGIGRNSMDVWGKSLKNKKGQVCFGINDGFSIFYPKELEVKDNFKIFLTDFFIDNIPVLPGKQSPLQEPIEGLNNLSLRYDQNNIGFNFSALDYRDPESISYFTMLEGKNSTWQKVTDEKSVQYFNLKRGKFIFHVKAFNKDGEQAEKTVAIIINPPWWQTWWAFVSYAVLLMTAIWGYAKWRTKILEKEKVALETKVTERTQELKKEKEIVESTLSELKSTQAQLIQSEKMASLGELTAGIAHEIQNPLNFVNNFSEVNREMVDEATEEITKGNYDEVKNILNDIKDNSEKINHHGKRADAIVKGMLQHTRTSTGQKELTDINALADEYLRLSYHGMRARDKNFNVTLETDFDNSVGKINVVSQDIGRVLLNLYNNAFYATSEKLEADSAHYVPTVTVVTKKLDGKIEISIKDNGLGIPQNIVDKIFQPFFTTKPTGQGTGLGLSLSYDIIKAHGGEIKVITTEGGGSEFLIHLPIA
ncbi:MAG TPA: two-component regulator propeller domain-containing protein [Parafilimonas sp.]|nr:two-component regulator propeller domain-containing protein [Parafilimonas sp.]